jgi:hypothetical protein
MFLISSTLSLLSPLLSTTFWSRLGFLISYLATSFLVLEVLRLIYTDDTKRDVEKFLDSYAKTRTQSPPRRRQQEFKKVSLEELDRALAAPEVQRGSPRSEKTLVEGERRRRSPSHEHPTNTATAAAAMTTSPSPRRLRKRSDTLNSTSSSESRNPFRRRREASPASEVGSKASSRQGSPLRRARKEDKSVAERSAGLRGLVRAKV